MVSHTANLLIVQLSQAQNESFVATLQYALERAIQTVYKLELNELASERLGENGLNLLFWESAEGGAGVLSQMLRSPESFQKLAKTALEICHFITPKDSCYQACYECLLSYQNQFDHPYLDRHLLRPFLEKLTTSTLKLTFGDRDAHYTKLLEQTDPNSDYERTVLQAIYEAQIPLPDAAQVLFSEADCKPDFVYQKHKIAVFCDGSVHDSLEQKEQDKIKRNNLQWGTNYIIFTFDYKEDTLTQVNRLNSLL
jgi:hypothetical protein